MDIDITVFSWRRWLAERRLMVRNQRASPGTCGACGSYLMGGLSHAHYTFRWFHLLRRKR
jgi:hypothetical protein